MQEQDRAALCFLLGHPGVWAHEALWIDWIAPNEAWIDVHVHRPVLPTDTDWIRRHRLPSRFLHPTSYFHVLPACLSLLGYAVHHHPRTQWTVLLTETCVPVVSPETFRERFRAHAHDSFLRCRPAYWNVQWHPRANLRHQPPAWRLANDPWFTLCREHVHACLHWVTADPTWVRHVEAGGLANESYFAMALARSGVYPSSPHLVSTSSTEADWTRMETTTSPYTFREATPDHVAQWREWGSRPGVSFGRKVAGSCSPDALRSLWLFPVSEKKASQDD